MKIALLESKSNFLNITRIHLDLIVAIECLTVGSTIMSILIVGIYLRTCFVKVAEVDAASGLSIFLVYWTMLANQVRCWMGLMKPTSKSLCISSLICTSSSALKFLGGCFTSLHASLHWVYARLTVG